MQIKIVATANLMQADAQFKALRAQVRGLNAEMAKTALIPAGGSPAGFRKTASSLRMADAAFNSALASSGAYRVEQLKINDAVERHTELLQKQKLTFREVFSKSGRTNMKAVYREQLAMQQMIARSVTGTIGDGSMRATFAVPTAVDKSWDTLNNKIGMFRHQLSSASQTLLNWGKNTQWAGRQLTTGISMPIAAFGAAAGVMAYQVDKQFTRIKKVYDTTADQNNQSLESQMAVQREFDALRDAGFKTGIEAARNYGTAITDTLDVQAQLAATGQKGAALQAATTEIMKNAMLGEIDYNTTTKATIALQQQLHLSSTELADTWAYMNSVENATSLSMADFAASIPIALGPIRQMGGDIQTLGTLMTGLISRGVQVGKAANAIKALPQRLLRPSKQIQEEWKAITGTDIIQIAEKNNGNIMAMLQEIYAATKNLSKLDQGKAFAGLFGSYQLTTMSNLVASMGDLEDATTQVGKAQQIGMQDAKQWGAVQRQEIKSFQESASGKFKIALESVKAELSTMGDPFLEVASTFLKAVSGLVHFFNSMPDWAKKGAAFTAIMAALIGPAIMLVGLFANLAGNIGKFAATSLRLVSTFELVNKSQWQAKISSALASKGFVSEAESAQLLQTRLEALTMAVAAQAKAMGVAPRVPLGLPAASPKGPAQNTAANMGAAMLPMYGLTPLKATEKLTSNIASNAKEALTAEQMSARAAAKMNTGLSGAAVSGGLMAASMGTMMFSSNETANNLAQMAMLAAIIVPSFKGIGVLLAASATKSVAMYSKTVAAAKAATANASAWAAVKANVRGAGVGLGALMGPVGWTALAVGAIGFGVYKWWQHEKAITAEKEAQNRAVYDQNNLLQDSLKISERTQKTLSLGSPGDIIGRKSAQQLASELVGTETGKDLVSAYKDAETSADKAFIATKKYADVLNAVGGDAQKARIYVEALFVASGDSATEAAAKAEAMYQDLGTSLKDGSKGMSKLWDDMFANMIGDSEKSIEEQGAELGQILGDSIARGTGGTGNEILNRFQKSITSGWDSIMANMDSMGSETLALAGINTGKELKYALEQYKKMAMGEITSDDFEKMIGLDKLDAMTATAVSEELRFAMTNLKPKIDDINKSEEEVAKTLAKQLGIVQDINSIAELRDTFEWRLYTVTKKNAGALMAEAKARLLALNVIKMINGEATLTSAEMSLQALNTVRVALGLSKAKYLVEGLEDGSKRTATALGRAAGAAGGLASELGKAYSFSNEDFNSILKSGMEGVTNDLADMASAQFDSRMNAAIDSAQAGWDSRLDALDRKQSNDMDKFDARWERRKTALQDYYDNKIKAVDNEIKAEEKAEEIRQRIFDAEQTRLERAAEAANRTIDFNVALQTGSLDEAAKIRNDMDAAAQSWALSDASAAGSSASQNRIDKLNEHKDNLSELADEEMKALEKREDQERKHLERVQELRADALKAQEEQAMSSMQTEWDARKRNLDGMLELFKSYTGRNQADLERWMDKVGLTYDDFGLDVKKKGDAWSKFFQESLKKHIRLAGTEIANDHMWENMGKGVAKQVLQSMGFMNMKEFAKFIMTGKLPKDFGNREFPDKPKSGPRPEDTGMGPQTNHGGGWIGDGGSGRQGVARNIRGLGPGERYVRARDNEFMVNEHASKKYGGVLEQINNGTFSPDSRRNIGDGIGGKSPAGIAGMVAALVGVGLARGIGQSFKNAKKVTSVFSGAKGASGVDTAGYVPGSGGYRRASVPGKGWYGTHDYQNGVGSPLYAFNDGTVVESRAITSGGSPGNGLYSTPYRSYGETIVLRGKDGNEVRYAHLNPGERYVRVGDKVEGGSLIGRSGQTGNASGPHTHFEVNGSYLAKSWFEQHGIGLKSGGYTTTDGIANLHKKEVVVSPKKTEQLYSGIDKMQAMTDSAAWTWLSGIDFGAAKNAAQNTEGGTVRTGTYNTNNSTGAATRADVEKLMAKADVLGLTDFTGKGKSAFIEWLASKGWGTSGREGGTAVIWNKAIYDLIDSGSEVLNPTTDHPGRSGYKAIANYARLKNRETGSNFWAAAAHTIAHTGWMKGTEPVQREQFATLAALSERLQKSAPMFLMGDFNEDLRQDSINIPGLKSNWLGNMKKGGGTLGNRYIDHILASLGIRLTGTQLMGGLSSNHNAALAQFNIPSLAKGAENVRWDNTLVNLHKKESVLTADQSQRFRDNVASGGNTEYNLSVYITEPGASADEITNKVLTALKRKEERKPMARSSR